MTQLITAQEDPQTYLSRQTGYDAHGESRRGTPTLTIFACAFVPVAMMLCAWTFATPIGAAPDEPNHIIDAVSVVRGEFNEPLDHTPYGLMARVRVPAWAEGVAYASNCFAHHPQVSAACSGSLTSSTTPVNANTQFSNAPPLYYVIIGVPTLIFSGSSAVYAMRLTGDVLNAALVALGLSLLIRFYPRRTPILGALLALTPMSLFLMSVVNSSALEISAAFATWCGAICVAEYPVLPRGLAMWTGVAAALLTLSRPTSPIDVAIVAVSTMVLIGWHGLQLRWNARVRWLLAPIIGAVLIAILVLAYAGLPRLIGTPLAHPKSLWANTWAALQQLRFVVRDAIGNFGWLDTPVSSAVVVVWTSCLAVITLVALFFSRACRRTLPVLAFLIVAMVLVLESPHVNAFGLWWQGRYSLPVLIGFPLVATVFQWPPANAGHRRQHRANNRLTITTGIACVLGVVLAIAQLSAFQLALRRYQTGLTGKPHSLVRWIPPGGRSVTFLFAAGVLGLVVFAVAMTLKRPESGDLEPLVPAR